MIQEKKAPTLWTITAVNSTTRILEINLYRFCYRFAQVSYLDFLRYFRHYSNNSRSFHEIRLLYLILQKQYSTTTCGNIYWTSIRKPQRFQQYCVRLRQTLSFAFLTNHDKTPEYSNKAFHVFPSTNRQTNRTNELNYRTVLESVCKLQTNQLSIAVANCIVYMQHLLQHLNNHNPVSSHI